MKDTTLFVEGRDARAIMPKAGIKKNRTAKKTQKLKKSRKLDRRSTPYSRALPKDASLDVRKRAAFETLKSAKREACERVKRLKEACQSKEALCMINVEEIKELLRALRGCKGKGNECGSLACPKCMRRHRINFVNQFLQAIRAVGCERFLMLTLISSRWVVGGGNLINYNPNAILETVRRQFKQIKLQRPAVGFIDGRFRPDTKQFDLHLHLLIPFKGQKWIKRKLDLLRSRYYCKARHPSIAGAPQHGMLIEVAEKQDDELQAITSYVFKSFWSTKNDYGDVARIPEPFHTAYLLWRSRQHIYNARLMYRCRERNGRITFRDSF